jgi:hypothetical protein
LDKVDGGDKWVQ